MQNFENTITSLKIEHQETCKKYEDKISNKRNIIQI